jgi:cyclic-di-AMP phosphodiesterase PgpH
MSQEPKADTGEVLRPTIRETLREEVRRDRLSRFAEHRAVRPMLLLVPAAVAGLLLAPQLAATSYPQDEALLGTPFGTNVKAPYDVEVVDEELTQHKLEAALEPVRRVYDFDVQLGDKIGETAIAAFALGRHGLDTYIAEHGERDLDLPRELERRLRSPLAVALAAQLAEMERQLGTPLRPEEIGALLGLRFDPEVGKMLAATVRGALAQPVVASPSTLDSDRKKGISIQRVAERGGAPKDLAELETIPDLEAVRRDLPQRVRRDFPEAAPIARDLIASLAARLLEPNLTLNKEASFRARGQAAGAVAPAMFSVKKGEMVIRDGERLTHRHLLIFQKLSESSNLTTIVVVALGGTLTVLVLILAALHALRARGISLSSRDMVFCASLFVFTTGMARIWFVIASALHERFSHVPLEALYAVMPLAAGAMIMRLVLRVELSLWFAVLVSLIVGLLAEGDRLFAFYALVGSAFGVTRIRTMAARGDLVRAGLWVGLSQAITGVAILLFGGVTDVLSYVETVPMAMAGGILAGLVTLSLTPVVELLFGYTTDLKLLELANLNHPALKELIVQAPGSYHHSVLVGSLVEAAAESIGANPLLARVMAYYHDLGKGCNPGYFIENQRAGHNPHDKLKAPLSAMIIKRHVTDGLDLARRHKLGEAIMAGIAEHHGTTLIHFFFHKAKEEAAPEDPPSENDYRYPGRKPQSREAALVMLGDSIEAASRSLADPTPARLQGLVSRIINMKFTDGQLDDCDLTLKDLHVIAKSFSRILNSIYHTRPEYPELLRDLGSKKPHGDTDPKSQKRPKGSDDEDPGDRPDNLRRLGLS